MSKFLRRLLIHVLIFVLGMLGTAFLLNSEATDDRSDMNNPVYPEVMVEIGDLLVNRMCGYTQPMQADFVRDSLTPLNTAREICFAVNPCGTEVSALSYEIRTSDGSKVLENRKIKNLVLRDGYFYTDVQIGCDLRVSQEYSMQITLDTEAGEVYYYTRVISRQQLNTEQYIAFAKNFYEKCLDKAASESLGNYLETVSTGTPTNYASINIASTLGEIGWGSMKPTLHQQAIPTIKEINETTASIEMEYQITSENEEGNTELYDVREFYRMRYTDTRIMLLDFERSANQIFDPKVAMISEEGLTLGVRNKNVVYASNEDTSTVVFVQQGDLWSYEPDSAKMVKIFSFRREEDGDFRDSRQDHDIKIIRVGEEGDVDFVLYGYMNRGIHEGQSGVCVYHYNSDQNVVEERVFIPSTKSYEFLNQDLGMLAYVNENHQLFLLLAEKLYFIDINGGIYSVLEEGIEAESFVISETNAHAAWKVMEGEQAGKIKMIDFDTRKTRILTPSEKQILTPVGFLNEDLVYGIIVEGDILTDDHGMEIAGIHTIRIENFQGELKKEYHKDGYYITDVIMGSSLMEFQLCRKSKGAYVPEARDNIMNNKKAAANTISVEFALFSRTGTQVRLAFEEAPEEDEPLVLSAKMRNVEEQTISLDTQIPEGEVYYVYAHGRLDSIYTNAFEAVMRADECTGVVLNSRQQYIWERGNQKTQIQLNIQDIPEIMLTASLKEETLQEGLGEEGTILNLSGCTLESVLYEVSVQRPVIVKTGKKSSLLIVGYDAYNTYLYNPRTGETKPYGMQDSTKLFKKAGNIFFSYAEAIRY